MEARTERVRCERRIGKDGLHATEREVLALFDAGAGIKNIEFITGLKKATILAITNRFCVTALEPWKEDARLGSAALLAAIRLHHPGHCGVAS